MSSASNPLASIIVRFTAESSEFKAGIDGITSQLGNLGEEAIKFGTNFAKGLAFAEVAKEAFEAGEQIENAMSAISRATGATGDQLQSFEETFKTAFSDSVQSSSDLASGLSLLSQRSGATGEELQKLVDINSKLAQVTGQQLTPLIDQTQKLFAAWGVTVDEQPAKLDSLLTISQKTGISISALAGNMQTAGATLRTMGLSFTDSAALLANFEEHGVNTGRVMMTLNQALVTLSKEGFEDPKAALGAMIQKIVDAKDPTEQLRIATEEFKGRGLIPLADAIKQGVTNFGDLAEAANNSQGKIQQTAKDTGTLGDSFDKLKHNVVLLLEPLGGPMVSALNAVISGTYGLTAAIKGLADGADKLDKTFGTNSEGLTKFFGAMDVVRMALEQTPSKFGLLLQVISGTVKPTADLTQAQLDLAMGIGTAGTSAMEFDKTIKDSNVDPFAKRVQSLADSFKDLGVKLPPTSAEIDKITNAFERIKAQYESGAIGLDVYNRAVEAFGKQMNAVLGKADWQGPIDALGDALKNLGVKDAAIEYEHLFNNLDKVTQAYDTGKINLDTYSQYFDKLEAAAEKANPQIKEFGELLKVAGPNQGSLELWNSWNEQLALAQVDSDTLLKTLKPLTDSIASIALQAVDSGAAMKAMGIQSQSSLNDMAEKAKLAYESVKNLYETQSDGKVTLNDVTRLQDAYTEALRRSQLSAKDLREENILGIADLDTLKQRLGDAQRAYEDLSSRGLLNATTNLEAMITQQQLAIAAAQQEGKDTTDLQIALDQTTEALSRQKTGWADLYKQLNQTALGDIQKAFTDILFNIGQVGTDFKKLGEDMVDVVVNRIIKDAMTPLLDSLDKVIADAVRAGEKVLGIGTAATNGTTPTTLPGGVIPGLGGLTDNAGNIGAIGTGAIGDTVATGDTLAGVGQAASSGSGAAGSAAGSIISAGTTALVGAVAGVVSAVTGVIGVFQSMHQETSLNAIEGNTRYAMIHLQHILEDGVNKWLPYLKNINDTVWEDVAWLKIINDTLWSTAGGAADVAATLKGTIHNDLLQVGFLKDAIYDTIHLDLLNIYAGIGKMDLHLQSPGGGQSSATFNIYGATDPQAVANQVAAQLRLQGVPA